MGNWQTINYEADINDTIKYLPTGSTNRRYQLPNGAWANNTINYWYTLSGSNGYVNLNAWRDIMSVPFTFGGGFRNASSTFIITPTVTSISSGYEIGNVRYRGVYGGGYYRSPWLTTTPNSGGECSMSLIYTEGSTNYPLTAISFQVDYRSTSMLASARSYLPFAATVTTENSESTIRTEKSMTPVVIGKCDSDAK